MKIILDPLSGFLEWMVSLEKQEGGEITSEKIVTTEVEEKDCEGCF